MISKCGDSKKMKKNRNKLINVLIHSVIVIDPKINLRIKLIHVLFWIKVSKWLNRKLKLIKKLGSLLNKMLIVGQIRILKQIYRFLRYLEVRMNYIHKEDWLQEKSWKTIWNQIKNYSSLIANRNRKESQTKVDKNHK